MHFTFNFPSTKKRENKLAEKKKGWVEGLVYFWHKVFLMLSWLTGYVGDTWIIDIATDYG